MCVQNHILFIALFPSFNKFSALSSRYKFFCNIRANVLKLQFQKEIQIEFITEKKLSVMYLIAQMYLFSWGSMNFRSAMSFEEKIFLNGFEQVI